MQTHGLTYLYGQLARLQRKPLFGQIDLTYACDYDCVHCYCKRCRKRQPELSTQEIKKIFDQLQEQGCLSLGLSGGDPLTRPDFKAIYLYARQKGFIVSVLTNGYRLDKKLINFFAKHPPCSIDITLNSLKPETYQLITGASAALNKVKRNIKAAARAGLNIIIKANCLKENKAEIGAIKHWCEAVLGKPQDNLHRFRYDKIIFPRLNGAKEPCRHRLSVEDLVAVTKEDREIEEEYRQSKELSGYFFKKKKHPLYLCNTWKTNFFIDPYGTLKFCSHSENFSTNLRKVSFKQGFYKTFKQIAKVKFKTNSPCRTCDMREYCHSCPAIAYLETGDQEKPAEYFCRMAKNLKKEIMAQKKAR